MMARPGKRSSGDAARMMGLTASGSARNADSEVSVAVATRGRPEAMKRLLGALEQGIARPSEIVVVDQSDDDRTEDLLSGARQDMPIVYIRDSRVGLGLAQNVGFRAARSSVVAITDDDCVPDKFWISAIGRAFAADASLAGLTGRVLSLPPTGTRTHPVATRPSTTRREFAGKEMPWYVGSGNNFAVRREWICRIGGNDERLGPGAVGQGGVDMDLFYRLLRAGGRIRYEPDVLVHHEPATEDERLARRGPYGYGIGAGCVLRILEDRDPFPAWMLARWFAMRSSRLLAGLARGDGLRGREEALVLSGTIRGVARGFRLATRRRRDA